MRILTPRQRKFITLYLRYSNATRAAIEAGYSPREADSCGGRLLRTDRIKKAIQRANALAEGQAVLSIVERKEILARLATQIGNHDPADFVESGPDGVSIRMDHNTPNRLAVAGLKSRVEKSPGGDQAIVTDLKLRDPTIAIKAIDTLNRMDGLYRDQQDVAGVSVSFVIQSPDGQAKQVFDVTTEPIDDNSGAGALIEVKGD
jgi:phage terminase small subunit